MPALPVIVLERKPVWFDPPSFIGYTQIMDIDRTACSQALAKAIAHKQAGNDALARNWAAYFVRLLGSADILDETRVDASHCKPAR